MVVSAPFLVLSRLLPQFTHVVADDVDTVIAALSFLVVAVVHLPLISQPAAPKHTALIFFAVLLEQVVAQWGLLAQRAGQAAPITAGRGPHVLGTPVLGSAACETAAKNSTTAKMTSAGPFSGAMIARGLQQRRATAVWCR
jgi:hypothetical protein